MNTPRPDSPESSSLRDRAEMHLAREDDDLNRAPPEAAAALIHELRVHQMELRMQNEELRRAQQELEEAHDRLHDLYNLAPVGYVTMSREGRVFEANLTAATILGISPPELTGSNFTDFIGAESQDDFYFHRQEVFGDHDRHSRELQMKRRNGAALTVRLESVAFRGHSGSGESETFRTALIDITGRRQAEGDQARLASLVRSSPAAIVGLSLDGIIEHWNPGAARLFGFTEDEALGREVSMLHPENQRGSLRSILETIEGGGIIQGFETVRLHKDGTPIDVAMTISPVRNAGGEIRGLSGILLDIRERKRLEREIVNAAGSEQRRIAMELHDGLGSVLTAIHWRLGSFGRGLEKARANDAGREAREIARELGEAISLLRDLTRGLQPLSDEPADLIHALRGLAEHAQASGRLACRFIGPDAQSAPLVIPGSGATNQLFRIAQEALQNALRHSGATRATIELKGKADKLSLKVSDNGCGFDPDVVKNAKRGSLGIGIMRHRAQIIGAKLGIRSGRSGGTDVVCEL